MRPTRNATPGPRQNNTGTGTGLTIGGGIAIAIAGLTTWRCATHRAGQPHDGDRAGRHPAGRHPGKHLLVAVEQLAGSAAGGGCDPVPPRGLPARRRLGSTELSVLTGTVGTSEIVGLRTSCGEAVRCAAATGRYLVNVHVLARRP